MAESVVIREFLVALGFKVDEKGLKNFTEGVEGATKGVTRLITTISGAALTLGAGVSAFASKLERLYFVSQRTGAAATSLRAFDFAARNLGVSTEAAFGTIENLARFLRNNPSGERYLGSLGVQTRKANGELRDTVDIMSDLGGALAKMPTWRSSQYASIFGIDENLMLAMRNGDFEKFLKQYREMSATTGLDKAADDSHQFMVRLRELGTSFENLGIRVEGVMLEKIGPQLDHFQKWMDEHGDEIARRIGDIANAFVSAAAAMGPPLKWLADEFLELDKATDGWSTKLLFMVGIFKVLGGFQIIGGIWKMVAALRAMGAATAAASTAGAAAGGAGLLGRLLPFAMRLGGGLGLLLHSGDLNSGEDEELRRRQALGPTIDGQTGSGASTPAPTSAPSAPAAAGSSNLAAPGFLDRVRAAIAAAKESERKYGVPWLVTFAQWALESGFGSSGLSKRSNNPFGMQAAKGQDFVWGLDHRADGTPYQAKFRRFKTLEDAFDAHAQLLAKGRPYANARKVMGNAFSFADALTGIYAEDRNYGTKLKKIMSNALQNPDWLAPATGQNGASNRIELHQDVKIQVNGTGDPDSTARSVAREQKGVADSTIRTMKGALT
ncbi:mannosyl-glycoprotein endo-beta-N-acetylglucosamidase [Burkholderia sp. Bp9017]|uniref:glucosaminidase domain-containing protein n=1 Tax=unclassified Burkholderia TaxID=2613784 RepID=UPI000F5E4C1C|nr:MULTISPECIES: glucosaminidase domain-containing protein [unclassified Burkholderia]RQZ31533.1 mannosyl-glycoprotein endo-beta-N-acetylglucosamidase [Burkholderia sp. Bp9017]RQZ37665.1 mannosyl-glycoprotein endo-beta-N-acetylglucosamidase [Burkholderia sp. Bp9016]